MKRALLLVCFSLSLFAPGAVAQSDDSTGQPAGDVVAPPQFSGGTVPALSGSRPEFVIYDVADTWTLEFQNASPNDYIMIFFGSGMGTTVLDLGAFGSVQLGITLPNFPMLVGPTDAHGYLQLKYLKPTELPPEVKASVIFLQGVSIDYAVTAGPNGPVYDIRYYPTTVEPLLLATR
jgi:hypothetical protein